MAKEFILNHANFINKKGQPPSLLSPETDGKLVRNPSNNIPKIILMIDDPVMDTPSSLAKILVSICKYLLTQSAFFFKLLFTDT